MKPSDKDKRSLQRIKAIPSNAINITTPPTVRRIAYKTQDDTRDKKLYTHDPKGAAWETFLTQTVTPKMSYSQKYGVRHWNLKFQSPRLIFTTTGNSHWQIILCKIPCTVFG